MIAEVIINGAPRQVPVEVPLSQLLAHLQLDPRTVVVERNGQIVRRDAMDATAVASGDRIELVHFVGGG